jgi:hypothetical protein
MQRESSCRNQSFAWEAHIVEDGSKTASPAGWRLAADNSPDHVRTQGHVCKGAASQCLSLLLAD